MGIELIVNPHKSEGDPEEIYCNTKMDELRETECLCMNCDRKNDKPKAYISCPVAGKIYGICVNDNMAIAITRCGAVDEHGKLMYKQIK